MEELLLMIHDELLNSKNLMIYYNKFVETEKCDSLQIFIFTHCLQD